MKEIYLLLNVGIIIFEILYYTLFMKFARKTGDFWKYLLLFAINTAMTLIFGFSNILSYLVFIITTFVLMKYLVKTKTNLYDMLFIFLMMLFKIIVEGVSSIFISQITKDPYVMAILLGVIKLPILFLFKNFLNVIYNKLRNYWNDNTFYIRYIFIILMLVYVISSCSFLIFNR